MKQFILSLSWLLLLFSSEMFSQTYSFTHNSIVRSYIVHLPTGYNASNQYPLVINMHGYTSNASQQQSYSQMNVVADTAKFIVVYPDGVNNAWNAGYGLNSSIDDVGFISALIDTMKNNFSVNANKVFACGMSLGGFMSYRLACELENKIAAIASVTGLMSTGVASSCQNNCPIPVMDFHGTTDPTVNYNGGAGFISADSVIKTWIAKDGCPQTPAATNIPDINTTDGCTVTKYVYSPGQNFSEVIFFKITGGGHTWPGAVPVPSSGNTNKDIKASGEIWNFFRTHSLQCGVNAVSENYTSEKINIFPNPSGGEFIVEGLHSDWELAISNIIGQKIFSKIINEEREIIDLSEVGEGVYILKVSSPDSNIINIQKIIIK